MKKEDLFAWYVRAHDSYWHNIRGETKFKKNAFIHLDTPISIISSRCRAMR